MYQIDKSEICYLVLAGSHAHGTNTNESDVDIKGIVLPPEQVRNNIFNTFNQASDSEVISKNWAHLRNPNNPKLESVIYSVARILQLATTANPSILEILWADDESILNCNTIGQLIRNNRKLFLTNRCRHTYAGYAHQQMEKINRHRRWLINPPKKAPERKAFGLQNKSNPATAEAEAYIKRQIELWNISKYENLLAEERNKIKELCWDLVYSLNQASKINWDNWPDAYYNAALHKLENETNVSPQVLNLIKSEHDYQCALDEWHSYQHWVKDRNPVRKALEIKHGLDTKHASHLVRLLRTGYEVLTEEVIHVKRPDATEILSIKNGAWSYEQIVAYFSEMRSKLEVAYKTTRLPHSTDQNQINELYTEILKIAKATK